MGDIPNLVADKKGIATLEYRTNRVSLSKGCLASLTTMAAQSSSTRVKIWGRRIMLAARVSDAALLNQWLNKLNVVQQHYD
jgi:hypothetical protein